MRSEDYWAKRLEALNEAQLNKGEAYIQTLNTEYQKAMAEIRKDINVFYHRFAKNNEVNLASARQMLTRGELKEFKWSVEEYIKRGRENALDQRWMKELENASIKVRMSRLEALQMQMKQQVEMLTSKRQQDTHKVLGGIYKDNYYRSVFELQKGVGLGSSFAKLDNRQLNTLLVTPWAPDGKSFSARIWGDRNKLITELQTTLVQGLIRGDPSEKMITALSARMGVSRSNAERLVLTESAYFAGHSRQEAYKEIGVEEYKILATLDKRTSSICRTMDGQIFKLDEAKVNVNYPPFHGRCRTTTIPHYEENVKERAARDEDGKTYDVPGDMTYKEWEKKHVEELQKASTLVPESGIIDQISYRKFSDATEVKKWEEQVAPPWLDSLTANEKRNITKYTGSAYHDINKHLRTNSDSSFYQAIADDISSGLRKFNLAENITVYRGVSRNVFPQPTDELVGSIFTEAAFSSTSLLESSSFSGNVKLHIRVPAKSRGAIVNPISDFMDSEYEFLLDKGTMFEIIEAKEENGVLYLVMEVLTDE